MINFLWQSPTILQPIPRPPLSQRPIPQFHNMPPQQLERQIAREQEKLKLLEQQLLLEQQKLNLLLEQQLPYPFYTRERNNQLPKLQPQYPLPVNSELPQPLKIRDHASVIKFTKERDYHLYVRQKYQLELPAHYLNAGQLPKPQQQYPLFGLGNELPQPSIGYSPHIASIIKYVKENQIPQPPPKEKSDIERESEIIYFSSEFNKLIQNGEQINYRNDLGQTLLILSVIDERYQVTKALLRTEQVDVNAVDHMNNSALHYAASKGDKEIIKAFAERKDVDLNAFAGNHNVTALQIAAKNGFDEAVQALIDANASVDICNSDKHTALHVAVFFGKENVVKVLLRAGADIDKRDINGYTALNIAKNIIEDEAKRDTIIKLLTANKVDVKRKAPDDLNDDPIYKLRIASLDCNFDEVRKLLEKGVDPNGLEKGVDPNEIFKHSPMALAALSTSNDYKKIRTMALLYKYGGKIEGEEFFKNLDGNEWISKDLKENIIKLSSQKRESVDKFIFEKDKEEDDKTYEEIKSTKEIAPRPVVYPINVEQVKKVRFLEGQ